MKAALQMPQARAATPVPVARAAPMLQRKCGCASRGASAFGECEQCRQRGRLQRAASPGAHAAQAEAGGAMAVPSSVQQALGSPGRPLDAATRARFEPLYGHDFGDVRVHTDSTAADSARAVSALAYTVGRHVVFGSGQFDPASQAGRSLLAHELAHTIQQKGAVGSLQRLAMDDSGGAMEHEADRAAGRVMRGEPVRIGLRAGDARVQGFSVTKEAAGGCGICYDTAFPGFGPQNAGREAHNVVQAAFLLALSGLGQFRVVELPFSAPGDENGRLDLVVATPTGFKIGEIKPATPNGETQGLKDLEWYKRTVAAAYPGSTVEPLVTSIPVAGGLPMPDALALASGCVQQLLGVVMMSPGLYGYFCEPPYSVARRACACRPPLPPPVPVPKDVKETAKEKAKDRGKQGQREDEPTGPPVGVPVPVYAKIAAALAAAAVLASAASKLKGLVKGRLLAAATAIAVLALLAKGAEASVGLEGEDPIETLLKSGDAQGQSIPDDIKEAMRKDPALRDLLAKAAKSGNFDEAKRAQAEALTRLIAEHRDEFSEEELDALLKATEGAKGVVPDGDITVERIKKAIAAKKSGGGKGSGGSGGSDAPPTDKPATETPVPAPDKGPEPAPENTPPKAPAATTSAKTPPERLVEGMAQPASGGPKFTESAKQKLLEVARGVTPPLTDAEVNTLLERLTSARGKTEDEVVEQLKKNLSTLRAKPGAEPGGDTAEGKPQDQATAGESAPQFDQVDPKAPPKPGDKSTIEAFDKYLAKLDWVPAGKSFLAFPPGTYATGGTYKLMEIGRDQAGVLYAGWVMVTIGKKETSTWNVTVAAGGKLYTTGRRYGTTRKFDDKMVPPASVRKGGAKP